MMKGELKIQKGWERNDCCTYVYYKVEQERRTNKSLHILYHFQWVWCGMIIVFVPFLFLFHHNSFFFITGYLS